MKPNTSTVIFAVVMGSVCAVVLTATAEFVREKHQANERAERYLNILKIFNIPLGERPDKTEIIRLFEEKIQTVGEDSEDPDYYQYTVTTERGDEERYVALPAKGPGLWGPIEGLIGLAPDGRTVTGVSFYKQEETPGLGGEIASKDFTDRFMGRKLFDGERQPALKLVRPGTAEGDFEVDAISGATMTSEKVQSIITHTAEMFKKTGGRE